MAKKKKKAARKSRPKVPRKIVTVQSRTTTVGKARRTKPKRPSVSKNAGYYMRQAKEKLYDELAREMIRKEKATTKTAKRKINKQITETRRKINKLK